jgi:hypothetical protein
MDAPPSFVPRWLIWVAGIVAILAAIQYFLSHVQEWSTRE